MPYPFTTTPICILGFSGPIHVVFTKVYFFVEEPYGLRGRIDMINPGFAERKFKGEISLAFEWAQTAQEKRVGRSSEPVRPRLGKAL